MIIPIIAGPTGVGKTSLSIRLAKKINGEIVSADSMQIYKFMDIGTAKVKDEETEGIPHYLINIKDPTEEYSVAEFSQDARNIILEIIKKGKIPIIVGGTGLYLNALLYGINYEENIDLEYRLKLEKEADENPAKLKELYGELLEIDPEAAKKISPIDSRRIIRALEIYYIGGKTKTKLEKQNRINNLENIEFKLFVLNMDRDKLYQRINNRVEEMLEEGLIGEVKSLEGKFSKTSSQAIGYKEVLMYLDKEITYEEMLELVKQRSRNYAKRQITWFKKNDAIWLDINQKEDALNTMIKEINKEK